MKEKICHIFSSYFLTIILVISMSMSAVASDIKTYEYAVYLGVVNYGLVQADNKDEFQYRFSINGQEKDFLVWNKNNYFINNQLMEGEVYNLVVEGSRIINVSIAQPTVEGKVTDITDARIIIGETSVPLYPQLQIYGIHKNVGGALVQRQVPNVGSWVKIYGTLSKTIFVTTPLHVYEPPVIGKSGVRTLKNFLANAMTPVGTTLYIYGGGWDWQDVSGSPQASTIGLSHSWINFFQMQNQEFQYRYNNDYTKTYYPHGKYNQYYYAGLDCSGYVGWSIYNTIHQVNGQGSYVTSSKKQAKMLEQQYGYGTWTREGLTPNSFRVGDIFSMDGHVWICLGVCEDESILLIHSSPSASKTGHLGGGVQLSAIGENKQSEAYDLAHKYMTKYYPEWSERYSVDLKMKGDYISLGNSYDTGKFSWYLNEAGLLDPDGFSFMSPKEILEELFEETTK